MIIALSAAKSQALFRTTSRVQAKVLSEHSQQTSAMKPGATPSPVTIAAGMPRVRRSCSAAAKTSNASDAGGEGSGADPDSARADGAEGTERTPDPAEDPRCDLDRGSPDGVNANPRNGGDAPREAGRDASARSVAAPRSRCRRGLCGLMTSSNVSGGDAERRSPVPGVAEASFVPARAEHDRSSMRNVTWQFQGWKCSSNKFAPSVHSLRSHTANTVLGILGAA